MKLSNIAQSQAFFSNVKKNMYEGAKNASKKSGFMRLSGPFISVASSLVSLSAKVSTVGEAFIKGLANIFGAPFSKKCSAMTGLKQLTLQLPAHVLALVFSPVKMVGGFMANSIGMAVSPTFYSEFRESVHSNKHAELKGIITGEGQRVPLGNNFYSICPPPEKSSNTAMLYG